MAHCLINSSSTIKCTLDDIDTRVESITDVSTTLRENFKKFKDMSIKYMEFDLKHHEEISLLLDCHKEYIDRLVNLFNEMDKELDKRTRKQKKLNIFFMISIGILLTAIITLLTVILI